MGVREPPASRAEAQPAGPGALARTLLCPVNSQQLSAPPTAKAGEAGGSGGQLSSRGARLPSRGAEAPQPP